MMVEFIYKLIYLPNVYAPMFKIQINHNTSHNSQSQSIKTIQINGKTADKNKIH